MQTMLRTAGWLATTALLASMLVAPATSLAAEGNPPSVECAGFTYYFKIDNVGDGGIVAGVYQDGDTDVETNWPGQVITISNVSADGQDFDWASTELVSRVVAKEGNESQVITTGLPATSGSVASAIKQGLSHVTFCGDAAPEPTPTPEPTGTPEPVVTPTPEPSGTVNPASPTPTGTVAAATGRPRVTPPPTDASVGDPTTPSGGLPIVLIALAGIMLATLALLPGRRPTRR